ncbi:MAG: hypothetical protein ACJAZS_000004 [Alteromonas naphthalenivorans]|jgi:hypothetical protein
MKKITKVLLFLLVIGTKNVVAKGFSPHMITFFFKDYPTIEKNSFKKVSLKKKNPRSGIVVSYFGFMATSDKSGEIMFPRRHQKPDFSLLVCDNPEPIFMLENTIHHWQVRKNSKHAFYTLKRETDARTKLSFWDVKKSTLPSDKHLPVNTLVVFAEPETIYVPEGITLTNDKPQLFLPPIYAKQNHLAAKNALAALELRAFFDPLSRIYNIKKHTDKDNTDKKQTDTPNPNHSS